MPIRDWTTAIHCPGTPPDSTSRGWQLTNRPGKRSPPTNSTKAVASSWTGPMAGSLLRSHRNGRSGSNKGMASSCGSALSECQPVITLPSMRVPSANMPTYRASGEPHAIGRRPRRNDRQNQHQRRAGLHIGRETFGRGDALQNRHRGELILPFIITARPTEHESGLPKPRVAEHPKVEYIGVLTTWKAHPCAASSPKSCRASWPC